jgi:hypothetical protein
LTGRRIVRLASRDRAAAKVADFLHAPAFAMHFPMPFVTRCLALAIAALAAGCASGPAPRVTRLGDGVFTSPTLQEAEAYCRNFGAPMRLNNPKVKPAPGAEVSFRCD